MFDPTQAIQQMIRLAEDGSDNTLDIMGSQDQFPG